MAKQIDPLPERYEVIDLKASVQTDRVMLAMETDRGPVAVHLDRTIFDVFVQQATYAQRLSPLPNQHR